MSDDTRAAFAGAFVLLLLGFAASMCLTAVCAADEPLSAAPQVGELTTVDGEQSPPSRHQTAKGSMPAACPQCQRVERPGPQFGRIQKPVHRRFAPLRNGGRWLWRKCLLRRSG